MAYLDPEKNRQCTRNWRKNNPDKVKQGWKKWYDANYEKRRNSDLKRNFGISLDEYNVLSEKQNHKCAICQREENCKYKGKNFKLAVDHDHTTGKVRGLLCRYCNISLGNFEDNLEWLRRATEYLENFDRDAGKLSELFGQREESE